MTTIKKLLILALFLFILYFIFIKNFMITFGIIAALYIVFKLFRAKAKRKLRKIATSKELFEKSELGLFVALVAKVAKADGRVQELEAQLIGNLFDDISAVFHTNDREKVRAILKEIFREAKEQSDNTQEIAKSLNTFLGRSRLKRKQYFEFLIQLAFVDGEVSQSEEDRAGN